MTIPPADHPLWGTIRFAIVAIVLSLMLVFGYETFDWQKDGRTIIAVLSGLGGFDLIKNVLTKEGGDK